MTAVIKVRSLPSAPYPPTPRYQRQTIEVPKDAKVVKVEARSMQTYWHFPTQEERKAHFNKSILPPKKRGQGQPKRELTEAEMRRVFALRRAGVPQEQIARELHCGDRVVSEAVRRLKADGKLPRTRGDRRVLTEDELRTVREMYEAGAAKHAISTALHCDYVLVSTTIDLMVEDGILQKRIGRGCPRELTRDEINMIVTLRKSGTPLKEISRKLRCNVPLIKDTIWSLKEKGRL